MKQMILVVLAAAGLTACHHQTATTQTPAPAVAAQAPSPAPAPAAGTAPKGKSGALFNACGVPQGSK